MWWIWKFATFYAASFLLAVALAIIVRSILGAKEAAGTQRAKIKITGRELVPATLLVSLFMVAYVDHRPLASLGLHFYPSWWQELSVGIVIGCIMVIASFILTRLWGQRIQLTSMQRKNVLHVVFIFVGVVGEELIARGYPWQTLIKGIGPWLTIGITSALFGLLHYQRLGWLGVFDTFLSGILFSLAILKTKALWMAIGIHFGWNLLDALLLKSVEQERLALLASIIVTIVTLVLLIWIPVPSSTYIEKLWQDYILPGVP